MLLDFYEDLEYLSSIKLRLGITFAKHATFSLDPTAVGSWAAWPVLSLPLPRACFLGHLSPEQR